MNSQNYIELEKMHFVKCDAKGCGNLVNENDDSHYFEFCKEHRLQFDSKSFNAIVEKNEEITGGKKHGR